MPAEFKGFFHRDPLAVRLEHSGGHIVKEVGRELERPDALELRDPLEEVL